MLSFSDDGILIAETRNHYECNLNSCCGRVPIPVAERSEERVCSRSLAGVAGSNPAGGMSLVLVVYCQVEVSATGRSLVQRSPTDCVVPLCVISKPQIKRRLKHTSGL